jgi:hypothetical protein
LHLPFVIPKGNLAVALAFVVALVFAFSPCLCCCHSPFFVIPEGDLSSIFLVVILPRGGRTPAPTFPAVAPKMTYRSPSANPQTPKTPNPSFHSSYHHQKLFSSKTAQKSHVKPSTL